VGLAPELLSAAIAVLACLGDRRARRDGAKRRRSSAKSQRRPADRSAKPSLIDVTAARDGPLRPQNLLNYGDRSRWITVTVGGLRCQCTNSS